MKEQLINFETAKLAKEKGFKTHTVTTGYTFTYLLGGKNIMINETCIYLFLCEIQKWLREVHKIDCFPEHVFLGESANIKYKPLITTGIDDIDSEKYCNYSFGNVYDTYEQAFEFGLQEALKLINN